MKFCSFIFLLIFASKIFAIEKQEPYFYRVGDLFLIAGLSVSESYNDNLFLQDTNTKGSAITLLDPHINLSYEGEYSLNTLDAGIEKGFYDKSSSDNYLDTHIKLGTEMYPSEQVKFTASFAQLNGHDARGTGLQGGAAAFTFNNPHEYQLLQGLADFSYGTRVSGAARLDFKVSLQDKEYDNHRSVTTALDRARGEVTMGLFYMLAPATAILIEGRYTDIDYDTTPLDSQEYRLLVGLEWEASYQTTGLFKVGKGKKVFQGGLIEDLELSAWEAGVVWTPLSYSVVTLKTESGFREAEGSVNFVKARTVSIAWKHDWFDYFGSRLGLTVSSDEYGGSLREDEITSLNTAVDYQYNRWLLMSAGISHEERDSNRADLDYTVNIYRLNFVINF